MPRLHVPRLPRSARPAGLELLLAAAAALSNAADEPMTTTADLLKDGRFKSAYVAALGPKAQLPWAARMSNSAPVRRHVFKAVEYQVATPCKPHDCADHNLLLLYAPASGKVFGHLQERGRVTSIGNPDPELTRELARLWKQEFRQQ